MITVDLTIKSIRSRGKFGGAIVFGSAQSSGDRYVVRLDYMLLQNAYSIQKGQTWRIHGDVKAIERQIPDGPKITENNISATQAELLYPSGENIVNYLSSNQDVVGVGQVKAQKLYDCFGEQLVQLIDEGNSTELQRIVSEESALSIIEAFKVHNYVAALAYLDSIGIPRLVGAKVLNFYGEDVKKKIIEDPYRLLSFGTQWTIVDRFAQNLCGIEKDSNLRLESAIEEVLYRSFNQGSTAVLKCHVQQQLIKLLGSDTLAEAAISTGQTNGQYYLINELYQPAGAWLMERYIADWIVKSSMGGNSVQLNLRAQKQDIGSLITAFEDKEGYLLTSEQRDAVTTSVSNQFSLIVGGAGVGKTTVLKCVYEAIEAIDTFRTIYQVALSGKAAKRMQEATGMDSYTIAGFLLNIESKDIPESAWIVVDEASMVDVITFYRLLRHIPSTCRLILVGDDFQLPPVGPGLILHALIDKELPCTVLKVVKRQSEESGIPAVAASIRKAVWPAIHSMKGMVAMSGVSFFSCSDDEITKNVLEIYRSNGGNGQDFNTQILSPTRGGEGGTEQINSALQAHFRANDSVIKYTDREFGLIEYLTSAGTFKVNDLIIFTRNDYDRELRNGSLGKIISKLNPVNAESPIAIAIFDDQEVELLASDLESIELAYSITVHKSQGSQFEKVIIPIRKSRLLDLSLLYTAITRSVSQVVLVGDEEAARGALSHLAANKRLVALRNLF